MAARPKPWKQNHRTDSRRAASNHRQAIGNVGAEGSGSLFYGELIRLGALLELRLPRPHEGRHLGCPMHRTETLPEADRHKRPLWAELVFAADSWLQWREGVFEYSHQPDCIFRAQLSRLSSDVLLSDGTFGRRGERVIDLHLWNEQIPVTPMAIFPGMGMPVQPELRKIPPRISSISNE
jgi:hypothetical protein